MTILRAPHSAIAYVGVSNAPMTVLAAGPAPCYTRVNLVIASSWPQSAVDGLIDEVATYNRALKVGEIAGIHVAGSAGVCRL